MAFTFTERYSTHRSHVADRKKGRHIFFRRVSARTRVSTSCVAANFSVKILSEKLCVYT